MKYIIKHNTKLPTEINLNYLIIIFKKNNTFFTLLNKNKRVILHNTVGLIPETHKKSFLKRIRVFLQKTFRLFSNKILTKYGSKYQRIILIVKGTLQKCNTISLLNIFYELHLDPYIFIDQTSEPHNGCRLKKLRRK